MIKIDIYQVRLQKVGEMEVNFESTAITAPENAAEIVRKHLEGVDREHFVALLLNTKTQIIGINTVHIGSLAATVVHPREVFKPAILANAGSIIVAHNHPSGDPTPSPEDIDITERLVEAGKSIGISVIDHVVIGDYTDKYFSMAEHSLI